MNINAARASSECFTLQDNFTEGSNNIMTNQVGIDMNEADGDDLLQYNPNRLLDTLIENLRLKTTRPCRARWKWRRR